MTYLIVAVVAIVAYVKREQITEWIVAMWEDDQPDK